MYSQFICSAERRHGLGLIARRLLLTFLFVQTLNSLFVGTISESSAPSFQRKPRPSSRGMVLLASAEDIPRCLRLQNQNLPTFVLREYARSQSFYNSDRYFCASDAPSYLRCRCPVMDSCQRLVDPFGRNVGSCSGFSAWRWVVIAGFILGVVVLLLLLLTLRDPCKFTTAWWAYGYSAPLPMMYLKMRQPVPCPPGVPFTHHAFSRCPPATFVDLNEENRELEVPAEFHPDIVARAMNALLRTMQMPTPAALVQPEANPNPEAADTDDTVVPVSDTPHEAAVDTNAAARRDTAARESGSPSPRTALETSAAPEAPRGVRTETNVRECGDMQRLSTSARRAMLPLPVPTPPPGNIPLYARGAYRRRLPEADSGLGESATR